MQTLKWTGIWLNLILKLHVQNPSSNYYFFGLFQTAEAQMVSHNGQISSELLVGIKTEIWAVRNNRVSPERHYTRNYLCRNNAKYFLQLKPNAHGGQCPCVHVMWQIMSYTRRKRKTLLQNSQKGKPNFNSKKAEDDIKLLQLWTRVERKAKSCIWINNRKHLCHYQGISQ